MSNHEVPQNIFYMDNNDAEGLLEATRDSGLNIEDHLLDICMPRYSVAGLTDGHMKITEDQYQDGFVYDNYGNGFAIIKPDGSQWQPPEGLMPVPPQNTPATSGSDLPQENIPNWTRPTPIPSLSAPPLSGGPPLSIPRPLDGVTSHGAVIKGQSRMPQQQHSGSMHKRQEWEAVVQRDRQRQRAIHEQERKQREQIRDMQDHQRLKQEQDELSRWQRLGRQRLDHHELAFRGTYPQKESAAQRLLGVIPVPNRWQTCATTGCQNLVGNRKPVFCVDCLGNLQIDLLNKTTYNSYLCDELSALRLENEAHVREKETLILESDTLQQILQDTQHASRLGTPPRPLPSTPDRSTPTAGMQREHERIGPLIQAMLQEQNLAQLMITGLRGMVLRLEDMIRVKDEDMDATLRAVERIGATHAVREILDLQPTWQPSNLADAMDDDDFTEFLSNMERPRESNTNWQSSDPDAGPSGTFHNDD